MKAFVIKNKEGKYWQWLFNHEPDWEDKLYNAFLHYSKEDAEKSITSWQLEDCKVVEITIVEGDLEKENQILNEALKLACIKLLKNEFRNDVNTIGALENDFIEQAKENIR